MKARRTEKGSSTVKFSTKSTSDVGHPKSDIVRLRWNNWDDYGRKTSFRAILQRRNGQEVDLGMVKVLTTEAHVDEDGATQIPSNFSALSEEYFSLGQSAAYYEAIASLPEELAWAILDGLRDAAVHPGFDRLANDLGGWKSSLLRFGEAENALKRGRELFAGGSREQEGILSFEYEWRHHGGSTQVGFNFDDSGGIPGRCNAIVGYNGVGKTALLADLAMAASGVGDDRRSDEQRSRITDGVTFGAVVAVSYSAFDTFNTPELDGAQPGTESFGYVYCGLRKVLGAGDAASPDPRSLKSIDEVETELTAAAVAANSPDRTADYSTALRLLLEEPSFGRIGFDLEGEFDAGRLVGRVSSLSTGHKIVLNIVTQLSAHLQPRSLVLIDEPETHLHPPLMAALLRAVQSLLRATDSFAVIATHSPVVVQETPGAQVRILERFADETTVRVPDLETFGESIGTLTRHIFSLDSSATDYQGVLRELASNMSREQIDALFEHGLSGQAFALVSTFARAAQAGSQ